MDIYEHPLADETEQQRYKRWARIYRDRAASTAFPDAERQFIEQARWYDEQAERCEGSDDEQA